MSNINRMIDSYFIATAIPELLTNSERYLLVQLMIKSVSERWSNSQMQELSYCINGVTMSILYSAIAGKTSTRRVLTEEGNLIEQLVDIQKIFGKILKSKSDHLGLAGGIEAVSIQSIKGYFFRYQKLAIQLNEVTITLAKKIEYYFIIEYPYLLLEQFPLYKDYKIGSSAMGLSMVSNLEWKAQYNHINIKMNEFYNFPFE